MRLELVGISAVAAEMPLATASRLLSRVGVEGWLDDPDTNQPKDTVVMPTSMKGGRNGQIGQSVPASEREPENLRAREEGVPLPRCAARVRLGATRGNLGYQMQYSVRMLERRLAEEGRSHVLQLNVFGDGECGWISPFGGTSMRTVSR